MPDVKSEVGGGELRIIFFIGPGCCKIWRQVLHLLTVWLINLYRRQTVHTHKNRLCILNYIVIGAAVYVWYIISSSLPISYSLLRWSQMFQSYFVIHRCTHFFLPLKHGSHEKTHRLEHCTDPTFSSACTPPQNIKPWISYDVMNSKGWEHKNSGLDSQLE